MPNSISLTNIRKVFYTVLSIFAVCYLVGCSTLSRFGLPQFGPSTDTIIQEMQNEKSAAPFQFQNLDPKTAINSQREKFYFSKRLLNQGVMFKGRRVVPGDTINLQIWEAASDGLFATNGKRDTSFSVKVSNTGHIDAPYAGSMYVGNRTTYEIKQALIERYQGKAIDPEIHVELEGESDSVVSVLGNVRSSGRVNIPPQGERLLDVIAMAGGVTGEAWANKITIIRRNKSEEINFNNVIKYPRNNVVILPNDIIHVNKIQRKFTVYGAVENTGRIELESESPSLSDLIASSGGLNDMQARADAVFVFRKNVKQPNKISVFRFDFSKPQTFIISKRFKVFSSDIVYIGSADASELKKFFTLFLSPILNGANSIKSLGK